MRCRHRTTKIETRRAVPFVLVCCLLAGCLIAPAAGGESSADPAAGIRERLDRLMRIYDAVGASVIVAQEGEVLLRYYYGYEDRASRTPVSADTHFRIASVTKLVSAIRVLQLTEQEKLDLDADISAYLGYPVTNPYNGGALTLRMLMSHTASLLPQRYDFSGSPLRSLIGGGRKSTGQFLKQVPGAKYVYSNFGAGLMGSLIEIADGRNADDSVKSGVFVPMGIDAGYSMRTLADAAHVASLYNADGSFRRGPGAWRKLPWDPGTDPETHYGITVGNLLIRPEDLCRLGMALAAGGTLDGVTLLQPETVAAMAENQQGLGGITAETPYGLCLHRETNLLQGSTLYGHQGHMWGTLCSLYWEPESQFTVLLVSNGCRQTMDHGTSGLARRVWDLAWTELKKESRPPEGAAKVPASGNPVDPEEKEEEDYIGRLIGLRIGIDPGHQQQADPKKEAIAPDSRETKARVAPGTRGVKTGIPEYQTNLEISRALREALLREGAEAVMTREVNEVSISNQERARILNEAGADLVLRIHCNGSSRSSTRGIGLYVNRSFPISAESLRAAEYILPRMAEAAGAPAKGVYRRDTYTGLNWSEVPAVLVECGYLTHPEEDLLLNDPAYQQKLAEGMVEGICDYFGR